VGGLAGVALVIGGDMEAVAHQFVYEALWPPEPRQVSPAEAAEPADRYRDILARILRGLLGPEIADI
jgi:hypothetical protein